MYRIALKMLFGDTTKYIILISALTFSALLMTQQAAMFCGLLRFSTAMLRNSFAKIWVVDTKVEQINELVSMRDIELYRVRGVKGVKWAMPLSMTMISAKTPSRRYLQVQLVGVDNSTLAGGPRVMVQGDLNDIYKPKSVIIDELGIKLFSQFQDTPVKLGDMFEINDIEATIVGICKTERSFYNSPFIYTTYDQSLEYRPPQLRMLSYVIAEPQDGFTASEVARNIEKETGLKAYSQNEFFWSTIWWVIHNTGIPVSVGTTILLGLIVGIVVSGQTFYSFVIENLVHFGVLKAMGVSNRVLLIMLLVQALTVGFIGLGLGMGLACLYGYIVSLRGFPPFFITPYLLLIVVASILLITLFAVYLGVRRISRYEPAEVFRG
jgi:putative ABC transport system permease protein